MSPIPLHGQGRRSHSLAVHVDAPHFGACPVRRRCPSDHEPSPHRFGSVAPRRTIPARRPPRTRGHGGGVSRHRSASRPSGRGQDHASRRRGLDRRRAVPTRDRGNGILHAPAHPRPSGIRRSQDARRHDDVVLRDAVDRGARAASPIKVSSWPVARRHRRATGFASFHSSKQCPSCDGPYTRTRPRSASPPHASAPTMTGKIVGNVADAARAWIATAPPR